MLELVRIETSKYLISAIFTDGSSITAGRGSRIAFHLDSNHRVIGTFPIMDLALVPDSDRATMLDFTLFIEGHLYRMEAERDLAPVAATVA